MLTFDRLFMESLRQWKTISWFCCLFVCFNVSGTICQLCDIFSNSCTCQKIPTTKSGMQTTGMERIKLYGLIYLGAKAVTFKRD